MVVALVAAVVGATIGSTLLPAETYGYVSSNGYRPSARSIDSSYVRDPALELRQQERRVDRLQEMQEEEVLHGSAMEEVDAVEFVVFYQAYLQCRRHGYQPGRSRFNECVQSYMHTGDYSSQH